MREEAQHAQQPGLEEPTARQGGGTRAGKFWRRPRRAASAHESAGPAFHEERARALGSCPQSLRQCGRRPAADNSDHQGSKPHWAERT